jgi:hypothetical protein
MPHFLIRNLDEQVRVQLEDDAYREHEPLQETVRMILCRHYGLDCPETRGWIRRDAWGDATTILVRMPQPLFDALKRDAKRSGESMQSIVHEALAAHYSGVT